MRSFYFIFSLLILFCPREIQSNPKEKCLNGEFTDFIVSIQTDHKHRCNGVIVNKNTVITTALCVTDRVFRNLPQGCDCSKNITVQYALEKANLGDRVCSKSVDVEKTYVHKWFMREPKWANYDIAVIKTKTNLDLESRFKYPVLPTIWNHTQMIYEICDNGLLAGYWDKTEDIPSSELKCLDVTITNFTYCRRAVGATYEQHSLTCTVDDDLRVNDVCKGYVGAPLFCKDKADGKVVLRAFLSHKHGHYDYCGKSVPYFYTRTDYVLLFLRNPEKWALPDE